MVPKSDGTKRLIINLYSLSRHIADRRLQMAGLQNHAYTIKLGDHMISCDNANAYFQIGLHPNHVKFCTIRVNGSLWEIPILQFGLKTSPYAFSKVAAVLVHCI